MLLLETETRSCRNAAVTRVAIDAAWRCAVALLLTLLLSPISLAADGEQAVADSAAAESDVANKEDGNKYDGDRDDGDRDDGDRDDGEIPAGHSLHGEAFNKGPRQRAFLMSGTGAVHLPVTTEIPAAQKFIDQGVGQLHGFWFFEAERSFRQAAKLDPDCAMAYWGMAQANRNNEDRAKGLIAEAVKRRDRASRREQMYIDALDDVVNHRPTKKERQKKYAEALEKLVLEYPEDLEAKAHLGYVLYRHRGDLDKSHDEVDAVLKEILAQQPQHPVHHYRIHLWDYKDAKQSIDSSAACGAAAPSIAHMWHMPGHTYSRLKRYQDAAWQQEASARVDHAQMIRDQVMPDQIHNYAHNNEWLIRNLGYIGRHRDAVDLAKNMIELPRHPAYNKMDGDSSAYYGRRRLFHVLYEYELWQQLIDATNTVYLAPTGIEAEQVKRLRYLGAAYARSGNRAGAEQALGDLRERLEALPPEEPESVKPAEVPKRNDQEEPAPPLPAEPQEVEQEGPAESDQEPAQTNDQAPPQNGEPAGTEEFPPEPQPAGESKPDEVKDAGPDESKQSDEAKQAEKKKKAARKKNIAARKRLRQAIALIEGYLAAADGDHAKAARLLKEANERNRLRLQMQALAGEVDTAADAARKLVAENENQVLPLASLVELLWQADQKFEAAKAFNRLREISGSIQTGSPVFTRLDVIARQMDLPDDWRIASQHPEDFGDRPGLDSLGPFRWQPSAASDWSLPDHEGTEHTLRQYRGQPLVAIFYLGHGCLHCVEQLQALAPMKEKFDEAGISMIAISSDGYEQLKKSHRDYDGPFPIPLVSDSNLDIFKAYHAYDDFEDQPLHGAFLIDPEGRIRWQDISYEPFMDVDFLLNESKRLLAQSDPPPPPIADKQPSRIDPAGIRGSVILGGGGAPPPAVRKTFLRLAGGRKARIVVVSMKRPAERVVAARQQLRRPWQSLAAANVAIWMPPTPSPDARGRLAAAIDQIALSKATGIWIEAADAALGADKLATIRAAITAVLDRDGAVGLSSAAMIQKTNRKPGQALFAAPLVPDAIINVPSRDASAQDASAPARSDSRPDHAGRIWIEIDPETALLIKGRSIRALGTGSVNVWLAASEFRPARQIVLKDRDRADLTTLRRAALARTAPRFPAAESAEPEVRQGTLMILGGGGIPDGLTERFIERAGGPDANIVVLPTASELSDDAAGQFLEDAGARNVQILAARTLEEVNDPQNLDVLRKADAVWFGGGRQWRFVDAYEGTKAEPLLHEVLQRGGVIGGSSAGASIQAEYLARGNPLGNFDIMAEGYERGLGFLKGVAIDQHFSQRRRFNDMKSLVKTYPQLLGIGIDEGTAIVVDGHIAEVVGAHSVHFYDAKQNDGDGQPGYVKVDAGQHYDLKARAKIVE